MNLGIIYQLRDKKNWWSDVVFYFVISLLIATVICYGIFALKIYFQKKDIEKYKQELTTVGTEEQKEMEKTVFLYQKKINDFSKLIKDHKIASGMFSFTERYTLPNVWFSKFILDGRQSQVMFSGKTEDMETLSRQTSIFEEKEYIKKIELLNTSASQDGKINFNLNLSLDPLMFAFIPANFPQAKIVELEEAVTSVTSEENQIIDTTDQENTTTNPVIDPNKNGDKYITSFDIYIPEEVVGFIDQIGHTISLEVPNGTDVRGIAPSIITSPNATVSPATGIIRDFTNPAVYTVTAENNSAQDYTVTITVKPPEEQKPQSSKGTVIVVIIILVIVLVIIGVGVFLFLKKRAMNKEY